MKILMTLCKNQALQIFNPKDPKVFKKIGFFIFIAVIAGSYLCGYCFFAAYYLSRIGLLYLLPSAIFTIASLMALISAIHRVEGSLIHLQDDAFLYALPLSKRTITLSRLIPIYIENLFIILAIFIPCLLAMAYYDTLTFGFVGRLIILLPFAPLLPLALGIIIGLIIVKISERFRHSKFITIFLTFAFVFIIYYYVFQIQNIENPSSIFEMISQILTHIYPLSRAFSDFLIHSKAISLLLYISIQVTVMLFIIWIASKVQYHTSVKTSYKEYNALKTPQRKSTLMALYQKELRCYLNSVPYVTNTAIIEILLLGISIYLQFQDLDTVLQLMQITSFKSIIITALPLMISFMIGTGTTTSCSIAMEGKHFWQTKVLPIRPQTIFLSKILVNLTLSIPALIISCFLLSHSLALDIQDSLTLLIFPSLQAILYSQLGLIFNLHIPHLSWESEIKAVKQGYATMLTILAAMALNFIPIGFMQATSVPASTILQIVALVVIISNVICAIYLNKYAPKKFHKI